ncbi:MAG: peptidoglycan-binding protein [Blastocatellales bacterium]
MEYSSTSSAELSRWLNPPLPQTLADANSAANSTITPSRKVNIDSMRVIQIQQALTSQGFYSGETTGVYDQNTIEAMRRFQASNKIAATGYPTAHALKRLGLGKW